MSLILWEWKLTVLSARGKISTTDNSSSGTFSHRNVLNKKDKKQNKTPHLQMKSGVEL